VRDHHDRHAAPIEFPQKVHDLRIVPEILPRGGLVEDDELGVQRQNRRDGHALFLPEAQSRHRPLAEREKPADAKRRLHVFTRFVFSHTARDKTQRNLVEDLHLAEHLVGVLHHIADVVGPLFDRPLHEVPAIKRERSLLLLFKAADDLGKCRFARAVRADDGEHFALADRHGHVAQGLFAVGIGKADVRRLQ